MDTKLVPLEEAWKILKAASAVVLEGGIVTYPMMASLNGDPENEFMRLSYEEDGLEFCYIFIEDGNNEYVKLVDDSLYLRDNEDDGTLFKITPLYTRSLCNF